MNCKRDSAVQQRQADGLGLLWDKTPMHPDDSRRATASIVKRAYVTCMMETHKTKKTTPFPHRAIYRKIPDVAFAKLYG